MVDLIFDDWPAVRGGRHIPIHAYGLATLNSGGVHPKTEHPWTPSSGLATLNSGGVHPIVAERAQILMVWLPSILGASTPFAGGRIAIEWFGYPQFWGRPPLQCSKSEIRIGLATLNSGGVHPPVACAALIAVGLATLNSGGVHPTPRA